MSNEKKRRKPVRNRQLKDIFFSFLDEIKKLRFKALYTGWILGLLLLISLFWIFSQRPQMYNLMRTVNNVFINNNDSRRITSHLQVKNQGSGILGYWYFINYSSDKLFVFTLFRDGILLPLGAVVSADGIVNEVIPLSAHAEQVFDDIPESILKMYIKRIEDTALTLLTAGTTAEGARR